jgi:pimeloyl-ACP methyl ester carboxylesterase
VLQVSTGHEPEGEGAQVVTEGYRDVFVTSSDGLRLYARDYGPIAGGGLPVVCLPGLARTSQDFHELALALATDERRPRRVLALDYRGRGRSDWDPDWRNYDVRIELTDVLQVLTAAGIEEAVFIGTSRGGLITMALSAARPALIRATILNDIGPAIDGRGLIRIRSYVGKLPNPRSLAEGAQILKQFFGIQFPRFTDAQWESMARGTWHEREGRLVASYDPKLMKTLEAIDLETPLPTLWPLFDGLKEVPVMVVRGANSDILGVDTVAKMQSLHPRLEVLTVPDQGHAPLLKGDAVQRIKRFVQGIS